jgi:hypothetical protein
MVDVKLAQQEACAQLLMHLLMRALTVITLQEQTTMSLQLTEELALTDNLVAAKWFLLFNTVVLEVLVEPIH